MTDSSYELAPQSPEPPKPPAEEPQAPAPPAAAVPAASPAAENVTETAAERICPHCGFRTIGKPAKGRCPECSGIMDMAAAADLLQFARASWLRMISWSALMVALALVAHLAAASAMSFQPWLNGTLAQVGAAVLLAAGMWMITAHEPGGLPQRRKVAAQVARWLSIGSVVAWFALYWAIRGHTLAHYKLLMTLVLLVQGGTAMSAGFFVSALSARIPNDALATQFQNLAWLVPAALVVAIVDLHLGLQAQFGYLFYCVFPILGVLGALILWPAAALMHLALELRNVATASDSIIYKRTQRAQQKKPAT